jgi:hypothetical protein
MILRSLDAPSQRRDANLVLLDMHDQLIACLYAESRSHRSRDNHSAVFIDFHPRFGHDNPSSS